MSENQSAEVQQFDYKKLLAEAAEEVKAKQAAEELERDIERCWGYAQEAQAIAELLAHFGIPVNLGQVIHHEGRHPAYIHDGIRYILQPAYGLLHVGIDPARCEQPDNLEDDEDGYNWQIYSTSNHVSAYRLREQLPELRAELYTDIQRIEADYSRELERYQAWLTRRKEPPPPKPELPIKFLVCHDLSDWKNALVFAEDLVKALAEGWSIVTEESSAVYDPDAETYRLIYVVRLANRELKANSLVDGRDYDFLQKQILSLNDELDARAKILDMAVAEAQRWGYNGNSWIESIRYLALCTEKNNEPDNTDEDAEAGEDDWDPAGSDERNYLRNTPLYDDDIPF